MSPRLVLLDTAQVPGGGELRLFEEGAHHSIKVSGAGDLMSTRMHGSEEALARIGCERVVARAEARVLVGGLGFGFTLAATLAMLRSDARVVVAELVPAVVRWNRDTVGAHAGHPLRDPRVTVHEGDVAALIRASAGAWDAILLDVDNGPDGLTRVGNDGLYARAGLMAARAALRGGGTLAIWSAHRDAAFAERLRGCGFRVEEIAARAHGNRGARHLVWRASPDARNSAAMPSPRPARSRPRRG